jgi:aminomethyltransferase
MPTMKRTPLYPCHVAAGAKLVEFAGWEMPVQYEGVIAEHQAVRNACGLFDVSHMANFAFAGRTCRDALSRVLTNDIADLAPGHTRYSLICNEAGGTLDDVMVSCHAPDYLTVVANAANHDKLVAHFDRHLPVGAWQDDTDALALLALQGPAAAGILRNLGIDVRTAGGELPPRSQHAEAVIGGIALHLHHTGYSGELGFELAVAEAYAVELWERLMAVGRLHGLRPAGLAARDTLRLEAGLPLYGHELSEEISPIEAGLARFVDRSGRDYLGAASLRRQATEGPPREAIGLRLRERGVPRAEQPVLRNGAPIGVVTSGNHSPTLKYGIALALVTRGATAVGDTLAIEVRGRTIPAERIKLPFYRRQKP